MTTIRFQPNPLRALQVSLTNVYPVESEGDPWVWSGVDKYGFEYFWETVANPFGVGELEEPAKKAWVEEQEYRHARHVRSEIDGGIV